MSRAGLCFHSLRKFFDQPVCCCFIQAADGYQNRAFELHPGDRVFVYTDGVPETTDANDAMFGEERLLEALNERRDGNPEDLARHVHEAVNRFVGSAPQFDDMTMLSCRWNGNH